MAEKEAQKLVLLDGQLDGGTLDRDEMSFLVKPDRSRLQDARLSGQPATCDGVDPRDELLEIEGLDEIVVSPRLEACDPVCDFIACRQHDDHQLRVGAKA